MSEKYCECGCGQIVKLGNRYINGHSQRNKKFSKDHKRKIRESKKGKLRNSHSKNTKKKISNSIKKIWNDPSSKLRSDERNKKISEALYGKYCGSLNYNWDEDCNHYTYAHNKAWDKFGLPHCERCGINNDYHIQLYKRRLDMHNTLNPKDYTVMEPEAWQTLCKKCHAKIEASNDEL